MATILESQIQSGDELDRTTNKSTFMDASSQSILIINDEHAQQLMGGSNRNLAGNREKHQPIKDPRIQDQQGNPIQSISYINTLRIIKVISLLLIGACALAGMITSKITFVSITSRMFNLYSLPSAQDNETMINNQKSVVFFQLVFILVIPEILCLGHCLLWGFIGKSSKRFPWPSLKATSLVSNSSYSHT